VNAILVEVLKRDRAIVALGLAGVVTLSWLYLLWMDWGMRHMTVPCECAREEVVGLRQDTRELRIVLLDVADGVVDRLAHVSGFGQRQELIVAGVGREVEDAFGVIRGGVVHARAATR
jgi:hypothetical protein